jgi:hypothetical protein
MAARWLVLALGLIFVTGARAEPAAIGEADAKPAATQFAEKSGKAKKSVKKAKAGKKKTGKKNADKKQAETPKPAADEPKTTTVDKLPGPLKTLHVCSMPKATVEIDSERYAKSTIFFVSCTAARGGLTPHAVYAARDAKASGAKHVIFEGLAADGTATQLEMLYSVAPAREAYTMEGDQQPHAYVKEDTPWFVGAWKPDERPEVCAIAATWRLSGDKADLYLWEEAKECPKGELPKYEIKVDKKPPALVGR